MEESKLTDSYYDFLASEARQASLVAIAKKDIDVKESEIWKYLREEKWKNVNAKYHRSQTGGGTNHSPHRVVGSGSGSTAYQRAD